MYPPLSPSTIYPRIPYRTREGTRSSVPHRPFLTLFSKRPKYGNNQGTLRIVKPDLSLSTSIFLRVIKLDASKNTVIDHAVLEQLQRWSYRYQRSSLGEYFLIFCRKGPYLHFPKNYS